jgi:hypothetical protein
MRDDDERRAERTSQLNLTVLINDTMNSLRSFGTRLAHTIIRGVRAFWPPCFVHTV